MLFNKTEKEARGGIFESEIAKNGNTPITLILKNLRPTRQEHRRREERYLLCVINFQMYV